MSFPRIFELISGVATGLLGLVLPFILTQSGYGSFNFTADDVLGILLLFTAPGLLVTLASYFHATKRKSWGRVMLWLGSLIQLVISCLVFLLYEYGGGGWKAWLAFSPALTAIAASIVSLAVVKNSPGHVNA